MVIPVNGVLADCGDFVVTTAFTMTIQVTSHLDASGTVAWDGWRLSVTRTQLCNSSVPDLCVLTGPGEVESYRWLYEADGTTLQLDSGLSWKLVIPGTGPIVMYAGRNTCTYPTSGDVTCTHRGVTTFEGSSLTGDATAAVCAVLTP